LVWRHRAQNVGVDEVNHLLDDLRIKIADFIRLFVSTVPFEKGPEDGETCWPKWPGGSQLKFCRGSCHHYHLPWSSCP